MIRFNLPPVVGREMEYIAEAIKSGKLSGDNTFTKRCHDWFMQQLECKKTLLTPSCTHALEMAAILIDIQPGDEVIMPSYTFVSTANAFVMRGAKIVFVDIRPDTMNIDETLIEAAITEKTKAIVPVHYAGVACEMDTILEIANRHGLVVVEDAAQAMMSRYKGRHLGTVGHIGAFSFHETKNYTSGGEGGLLIINDERFVERAEIIREKGTNRSLFFRGMVDKYSWVDIGSSYLPCELQAAYLLAQLEQVEQINQNRLDIWHRYQDALLQLQQTGELKLPSIPESCQHNAHMFYLKTRDLACRTALIDHLKSREIIAPFHYIPLHTSTAGVFHSRFHGEDNFTTRESDKLLRLPVYYNMTDDDISRVITSVRDFYANT
ncbi:dTDP-4-amino-4,6-dideoxygalactose transaminase [Pseudomonas sp. JS3066]|uniref:dTDP-4-amino-4,6-dideoxygalactose transaminase n=1 Tax=Pseudomonas sp. JS3066 TaxID=3090665 RepID=UPI002E7AFAEC|nr:dTDP-4-amino-4,6-dideoxygalactose transaminase [Pseudomonas sp. JS3066]WVK96394.1 dTDP-4-amino-4,6-dideoxygalactose transaminase [Pseudomonas sp. JS3066]